MKAAPRMRTARLWNSLYSVLAISRAHKVNVSMAYVDANGKTRLLWRERDAELGSLLVAEAMAWTAVARALPDSMLQDLTSQRLASHSVYGLCDDADLEPTPTEGGSVLLVHDHIVGSVGIAGQIPDDLRTILCTVAVLGYLEDPVNFTPEQTSHFVDTQLGHL